MQKIDLCQSYGFSLATDGGLYWGQRAKARS